MNIKIFHKGKYYITFKRGFEDSKKDITITIDKIFETDSLKISLSDEDDPTFLCIFTVTRFDYEDLKKQQGLLIDFDNFPSQLVKLLQQCAANNMFLILQQTNPLKFYFEIVEHNEFKRLVHLSLLSGPATDADIKQHMGETIHILKRSLSSLKSSLSSSEAMWTDKNSRLERRINELTSTYSKLEEEILRRDSEHQSILKQERDKLAQERLQLQKSAEASNKVQSANAQELIHKKDNQIDEMTSVMKQLKDRVMLLENQLSEKTQRVAFIDCEIQKAHIEVANLKSKNTNLEREIFEKEKQNNYLNTKCSYLEKNVKENSDAIKDLNNNLQDIKREKASLEERLAFSESLASKNNEAAHATSEQLLKANQIISKLNTDLIEMKEKLLCRTAIALEQEKVIERHNEEKERLRSRLRETEQNIEKLNQDISELKGKLEDNEKTLKDRDETIKNNNMVIQWLHKKLEDNCVPNDMPMSQRTGPKTMTSSTPYFLPRHNHTGTTQGHSDDSIDFYATSKISNIEDSPQGRRPDKPAKVGLDPKYLQPAVEEVRITNHKQTARPKSTDAQTGKENRNINLPQVDYREKKSSKPNTYRSTPVSAYFP